MIYRSVGVVSVVVTRTDNLDVGLSNGGFLGKLFAQIVLGNSEVAVEEPAYQTEGKHVAALQHGLVVHTRVSQTIFHHLCDGGGNHILLDAHLGNGVFSLEGSLLQVALLETVCINDDTSRGLRKLILCFQCGSIHRYQHVALVTGSKHFACTDVHLESRYTCK